jgi:hypothetical protein
VILSNRCPYCGGPYSISQSCTGPRTADATAHTCPAMARHRQLVDALCEAAEEMTEEDEWTPRP